MLNILLDLKILKTNFTRKFMNFPQEKFKICLNIFLTIYTYILLSNKKLILTTKHDIKRHESTLENLNILTK